MSEWSVTFQDPNTGEEKTWTSPRPLRSDEVRSISRQTWDSDAKILRMDPYPGTPRAIREMVTRKPEGGMETPNLPMATGEQHPDWGRVAAEVAGLAASSAVGVGVPALAVKLGLKFAPHLPRLARFLGMTTGGVAGAPTHAVVAGRPEEALDPMGMVVGGAAGAGGSVLHSLLGGWTRHGRGGAYRVGEEMALDIERVGSQQTPVLKGLTTGESLIDWARRTAGQEGMNAMFETAKKAVSGALPPNHRLQLMALVKGPGDKGLRTFEQAIEDLKTLGRSFESPASAAGVQEKRHAWMEGMDRLYSELRRVLPSNQHDVIRQFAETRGQYAKALAYRMVLEDSGSQRILQPMLMQRALSENIRDIERLMGWTKDPTEFRRMVDVILRGATGRKPDPITGKITQGIGMTDEPGTGLRKHLRAYMLPTPEGFKFRTGMAFPHGGLFSRYIHGPGRLPLEKGPGTEGLLAVLAQLGRAGVAPAPER